jgi:hypothetical protein
VVTEWQGYTTTLSSGMGGGTSTLQYRRVGSSIEIKGTITVGTVTTGAATFTLPSGITINTSLIAATSQNVLGYWSDLKASANIITGGWTGAVYYNGTTTLLGLDSTTNASRVFAGTNSNSLFASGDPLTVNCTVPVAEWAGSGTTTLATRSVEEYAWNSDTTDASTTASGFSNGPSGVLVGSFTAFERIKRVRFTTPILSTDSIFIEINDGNGWINGAQLFTYIPQGTSRYGVISVQVNSTDVDVKFQQTGSRPTNPTYAGAGDPWSTFSTYRWRLRKVSSGSQIGFPVSARNIVGDTSGTVVPVGMIGENYTDTGTVALTATAANACLRTLQPGIWLVTAQMDADITGGVYIRASISTTSATHNTSTEAYNPAVAGSGNLSSVMTSTVLNLASATTVHMIVSSNATTTGTFNHRLISVRIA